MFTVFYHPKVRLDFRKIHAKHIAVLREAIDTKIAINPEIYGKPLKRTLKNLRSLRVGNYRIIYTVKQKKLTILVLIVGNRDKVYQDAQKRLAQ